MVAVFNAKKYHHIKSNNDRLEKRTITKQVTYVLQNFQITRCPKTGWNAMHMSINCAFQQTGKPSKLQTNGTANKHTSNIIQTLKTN